MKVVHDPSTTYDVRHVRTERESPFSRIVFETVSGDPVMFSMIEREADDEAIRRAEAITRIIVDVHRG